MPAGLLEGSADRIRWNAVADTEVAIVGAGVVGLAIAEQAELRGIARGLGKAKMAEGVRGQEPAARGAL